MAKNIWGILIIGVVLFAVLVKPEPEPAVEKKEIPVVEEERPSTEGGALSAASTDLSVVLKRRKPKPVVNIGAILPLSGNDAEVGNSLKNSLLLAKDDLKYQQNLKYKYYFTVDDGQDVATAYEKLKNAEAKAVVSLGSAAGKIIAPLAEKDKIIHVNFGSEDKSMVQGKYNFMNWTMPERKIERLVDYYEENNWKNIAFIGADKTQEARVQKLAEKHGIKITFFEIGTGRKDFQPVLQKSKDAKPDAYLVQIESTEAENFIKQYKEAGIYVPLTDIEAFSEIKDTALLEGYCYSDVAQSMDIFNSRVREAYPDTKSDYALGTIYDMVMLFVQVFENAETPEQAVGVLADTPEYDGVIGPVKQNNDNIFDSRAILKCVINGKPEVIYDPYAGHSH